VSGSGVEQAVGEERFAEFQEAAGALLREVRPLDTAATVVGQLQVDVERLKRGVEPHQAGACLVHLIHLAARLNIDLLEEASKALKKMQQEHSGFAGSAS
jgi:hypothetical protein